MARKIIFLERQGMPSVDRQYRLAFWLSVPAERRPFYVNQDASSDVRDATAEEIDALRKGEVVEVVETLIAPGGATDEQAFALLEGSFHRRQKELNDRNPYDAYGTFWDGETWVRGGVV